MDFDDDQFDFSFSSFFLWSDLDCFGLLGLVNILVVVFSVIDVVCLCFGIILDANQDEVVDWEVVLGVVYIFVSLGVVVIVVAIPIVVVFHTCGRFVVE